MARFSHRPKRIARRAEAEKFSRQVMPAALICCPVGLIMLLAAVLFYLVHGSIHALTLTLPGIVLVTPVVLHGCRWARGHFSKELDAP